MPLANIWGARMMTKRALTRRVREVIYGWIQKDFMPSRLLSCISGGSKVCDRIREPLQSPGSPSPCDRTRSAVD
jgi:hypothetical protein